MFKNLRKMSKNNKGFTILELIVVIAIMGFLIALVAPKLVGVSGGSKESVSITNMQRLSDAVERNITKSGSYPNRLMGLVPGDKKPMGGQPFDKEDSKWSGEAVEGNIFSYDFAYKNGLHTHTLNEEEANEIRELGITTIINVTTGKEVPVEKYTDVAMIGSGANITKQGMHDEKITSISKNSRFAGNLSMNRPELMYRIVLGIGEDSELITKGLIKSVPVDPESTEDIEFKNYCIVLPRLQSTVDRIYIADPIPTRNAYGNISVEGRDIEGKTITSDKKINLLEAQERSKFDIIAGFGNQQYPLSDVHEWYFKSRN